MKFIAILPLSWLRAFAGVAAAAEATGLLCPIPRTARAATRIRKNA
jgi:hypothetical protein